MQEISIHVRLIAEAMQEKTVFTGTLREGVRWGYHDFWT